MADLPGLKEAGQPLYSDAFPSAPQTDKLLTWIKKEKAAAMPHVNAWQAEAEQSYRFRDGKQLDDKDKALLKKTGRPDNAFNTIQKFVRFVTGVERHTPEALIFEPVDETDEGQQSLGEFMTRAYDWAIAKSYGDYERSRAFDDLIVTGMGWSDAYVSKDKDPKGLICLPRVPGVEMLWPLSGAQNLSDTRWRGRESMVDKDEAIAQWPDHEMLIRASSMNGTMVPRPEADKPVQYIVPYNTTVPLTDYEAKSGEQDKVRVLEWQWYDIKPGYYFFDPFEKTEAWYDVEKFQRYKQALARVTRDDPNYRITDYLAQPQQVWQKVFILNDRFFLTEPMEMPGKRFTLNCMTGYYDEEDKVFYGYIRVLRDPVRFANKFFNQVIEIMGTQAKGGLVAEEGAIPPNKVKHFEDTYAIPGSVNIVAPNAISGKKIMPKPTPEMPAASIAIIEFCIKGMENVTGIDPETAFGQGSTSTPGITLRQKQKSGLLLLNQEFSSLSRYRIEEGYIIFDLLKTLADDRLIRVGKPFEGTVLRLMRAPFASEYDLMLDETERDPNIRHMYAETVVELAPTLIRMNKFMPELLDYLPLPVKFRQALKKAIIDTAKQEQEMAEKGIASHGRGSPVSPQERQAKIEGLQSATLVNVAKAQRLKGQMQRDAQRANLDEMKTLLKVTVEQAKLRMERDRMASESMQKVTDHMLENRRMKADIVKTQIQTQARKQKPARDE